MYLKAVKINSNPVIPDDYPFSLPVIKNLFHSDQPMTFSQPITFLAGENGSGKSTLLEGIALALGMNPEGEPRISIFRLMIPIRNFIST